VDVAAARSQTIRDEVAELLSVSSDNLDPEADLIACGLDSIRMMSLSGRWRKRGIDVSFGALAENPTVQAWSQLVAERTPSVDRSHIRGRADEPSDASDPAKPFPLAPMQRAFWVGRNAEQELGGVAAHLYVEFDGAGVDPQRLRTAAAELAVRHPMLRVEILPDGTQRIGDRELPVTVIDLRDLDADSIEERLLAIREAKSHQLLDGEVLELSLSLLPGGRTRLHVDLDMQAADAMSYRNVMADLAALYRGGQLAKLGYTYQEYRAALSASAAPSDHDREWWARRIRDLPEPPALPLVRRSEQAHPHRSTRRYHWLDSSAREALFAAARRHSVTPAMAIAASFAGTLARWSTNPRFLLNMPMFGREPFHPDIDKLVGDFTSLLMLDIDLTHTHTAASRAHAVQDTLHTAAHHSSYSGLSVLRDVSRQRGMQTLAPFVFTSALGLGDLFAGDVTNQFGTPVWHISQGPQVLLDAQVTPFDSGLLINWDVREEAFRPGVIDAMFDYHLAELSRLAADDRAWDGQDPPAVPEDQRAIRAVINATTAPPSGDALHDGFFSTAVATPDAPAVFSRAGDLTYGQLRERALAVTAALRDRGVSAGDVVAVVGPKHADQIPALLGILAAGGAYLPIGADQPVDRAARLISRAGVAVALVCGDSSLELPVPTLAVAQAIRSGKDVETTVAATDPAKLAYVLYTSGSTGEPKGVEVTHDAAMNTVEFIAGHFDIGPADRCLALSTLEGDISVMDIFVTLRTGGAIVVVDEAQRRDPDAWARLIDTYKVTVLHFMPGWLEMLIEVGQGRLSSVRVVPTGGDWVRPEVACRLQTEVPNLRFAGLGGATETAVHNTIFEVREPSELPVAWTALPFGAPLPNNACRVVNVAGDDCPDWVIGELWVSGRGVARGYRGRPDLTAERFVEHDGRTWYRTGDLARYWPDGTLEFVGRADHRIKISGYRVELGEVEAALRRVPGVGAAVAVAVPLDADRHVLAALIRVDEPGVDSQAVAGALAELVPPQMIPQMITVIDRIPFTVGGKVDRAAVVRYLSNEAVVAREYRPPSTALELALADIIGQVLGRTDVGADDNFFALGGDSVLAARVVAGVRVWLDTPTVMVADIFATRTVSALAGLLGGRDRNQGRLERVAELYLEIAEMDSADVLAALKTTSVQPK
jgi:mycobactin phenyloxazoline synthetase